MTSHHNFAITTPKPSSTDTLDWDDLTTAQNQDFIGGMTKGSGFSNKKPPPLPSSMFHTNTMMALQDPLSGNSGQFVTSQAFTYDQFSGLQQGHPGHVSEHGYQQPQSFMMSRGLSSSSTSSSSSGKIFHSDLNNIALSGRHPGGGGGLGSASMALAGSGDHGPTDKSGVSVRLGVSCLLGHEE
ncbi:hypothetical protein BG000_005412 [Podila horticola]|nr:hypothetical protein BG000_005412 [Podila horticola]